MADYLEIEQKFDVDEDFERPDFGALRDVLGEDVTAGTPVRHQLSATYYDTQDERLLASKMTLRRRTGGTDEGWHLKLPAGQDARREVREPLSAGPADAGRGVPERLAARVADVTGGLPLAPIAVLDTDRTVVTLTGRDGRVVAEVADDLVTARRVAGSAEVTAGQPLRWREIEIEVPVAWLRLQQAAADLLRAAGARPGGYGSKLARLLSR
jgi:inorganic triphosphatase YgiF